MNRSSTISQYLRQVKRRLNMPRNAKDRVISDLHSSIIARMESSQAPEDILKELGTPKQTAADLNLQMKEYTYRKSSWRWLCLALAILGCVVILFNGALGIINAYLGMAASVGIIGGADGPTAIFVTASPAQFDTELFISAMVLILGIIGYIILSRLKRRS